MRGRAARDRSCARRERGDELSFRAERARGVGGGRSNARSDPVPLRFDGFIGGLQRDRSGARRERGDGLSFRAEGARGVGGRRSNARSGPPTGLCRGSELGSTNGGLMRGDSLLRLFDDYMC